MRIVILIALSVFIVSCANKNVSDSLFDGNLVPVNSNEIKQSLGANNEWAKSIYFFRLRYRGV